MGRQNSLWCDVFIISWCPSCIHRLFAFMWPSVILSSSAEQYFISGKTPIPRVWRKKRNLWACMRIISIEYALLSHSLSLSLPLYSSFAFHAFIQYCPCMCMCMCMSVSVTNSMFSSILWCSKLQNLFTIKQNKHLLGAANATAFDPECKLICDVN